MGEGIRTCSTPSTSANESSGRKATATFRFAHPMPMCFRNGSRLVVCVLRHAPTNSDIASSVATSASSTSGMASSMADAPVGAAGASVRAARDGAETEKADDGGETSTAGAECSTYSGDEACRATGAKAATGAAAGASGLATTTRAAGDGGDSHEAELSSSRRSSRLSCDEVRAVTKVASLSTLLMGCGAGGLIESPIASGEIGGTAFTAALAAGALRGTLSKLRLVIGVHGVGRDAVVLSTPA